MRWARLAALVALTACTTGRPAPEPAQQEELGPPRRLEALWRGGTNDRGRGEGPVVVLLHGYGAPANDLWNVPEWVSPDPSVRFAMPSGPLRVGPQQRAWWPVREGPRPADRGREAAPEGLAEATRDVTAWLDQEVEAGNIDPARLVIAGFSQGAMLATDVVLTWSRRARGLVILSGGPIDEARWERLMRERAGSEVLIAHGTQDPMLSYEAAQRLARSFEGAGWRVSWVSFEQEHVIHPDAGDAMRAFLERLLLL
jgi:phospholipase/carboxylesterase